MSDQFKTWADLQVSRWQAQFDARIREYMRTGGDVSPAALLVLAESVTRGPLREINPESVK